MKILSVIEKFSDKNILFVFSRAQIRLLFADKNKNSFICNEMKLLQIVTLYHSFAALIRISLYYGGSSGAPYWNSGEQLEGDKSVRRLLPRTKRQLSESLTHIDPCPCLCFYRLCF